MAVKLYSNSHRRPNLHNFITSVSWIGDYSDIVINVVIDGFSGEDLKWLAHITVLLQVSDYSQLFDYSIRLQFAH